MGAVGVVLQPQQTCTQKLMKTMMGDMVIPPVPMIPSNIPTGCSDFEVLIGLCNSNSQPSVGRFDSNHD
jgi:hypothetical protein